MSNTSERLSRSTVLLLSTLWLSACASTTPKRIADVEIQTVNKHPTCVAVKTKGGAADVFGDWEVPVDRYDEALRIAIRNSGVFAAICGPGESGLNLDVVVRQSVIVARSGISQMTRMIPVNWRLSEAGTHRVLYQEEIMENGTNKPVLGGQRVNIHAMEAAMRASIVHGLQEISQLSLTE